MIRSEKIDQLLVALQAAKKEFGLIKKDKKGPRGSEYASWDGIMSSIEEAMLNHGLSILAPLSDSKDHVEMRIEHATSHQYIGTLWPIFPSKANMDDNQAFGSGGTYAKRYAISHLLGLSVGEEHDPDQEPMNDENKENATQSKDQSNEKKITEKQLGLLNFKLKEKTQEVKDRIMQRYGSLEDIPMSKFNAILELLAKEE